MARVVVRTTMDELSIVLEETQHWTWALASILFGQSRFAGTEHGIDMRNQAEAMSERLFQLPPTHVTKPDGAKKRRSVRRASFTRFGHSV